MRSGRGVAGSGRSGGRRSARSINESKVVGNPRLFLHSHDQGHALAIISHLATNLILKLGQALFRPVSVVSVGSPVVAYNRLDDVP